MEQGHGWHPAQCVDQLLLATVGLHFDKRQRVVLALAVHKGAFSARAIGMGKPVVHHADQGLCGAEIGLQHVVPPGCGPSCLHVAVDVSTAKSINGLLGVTNQQQSTLFVVALGLIDLIKDLVLQR